MRLIGTIEDERKALAFSQFLQQKGIVHQLEIKTNRDWGSPTYGTNQCLIWIYEEDHIDDALKWFGLFMENPNDPMFNLSPSPVWKQSKQGTPHTPHIPPPPPKASTNSWEKQPMGWMTRSLIIACTALLFLSEWLMPSLKVPERYMGLLLFTSPVEEALLYDYPKYYQLIDRFLHLYGYEGLENPQDLSPDGQHLLKKINHTPFWPGIYELLLKGGFTDVEKGFTQYPSFEKISEGQIWRLFTPCLLHGGLFHLFFNMLWLIVLGKQIEARLRPLRYGIFILIIGIVSNTAQYLMSGSNFLGFSGILVGMLTFIWMRQRFAAWEGYQLDRMTILFMLVFIIGMALIQSMSFFLEKTLHLAISPNIANMAHLTGGLMGFLLGRMNFFSWRHT